MMGLFGVAGLSRRGSRAALYPSLVGLHLKWNTGSKLRRRTIFSLALQA
jgi:hypothetical protein